MLNQTTLGCLACVHGNETEKDRSQAEALVEAEYWENFKEAMENGTEFPEAPNKEQYKIWDEKFPRRKSH